MENNLKLTIVQSSLVWESIDDNLAIFSQKLSSIQKKTTDVIVLPEMFTTGFSMNSKKLAELLNGKALKWMQQTAKEKDSAVIGSFICEENDHFYNRLAWVFPNGDYKTYDKRHLFRFAGENKHFSPGNNRIIVNYKGWKICPLICFDLRFPVFSRNRDFETQKAPVYDCLIYVANWPEARRKPWKTLLEARAHENQCYVVGVNRIGKDGNDIPYSGDSAIYSPKGEQLSVTKPHQESIETISVSMQELNDFRAKFPVSLDADSFILQ